MFIDHERIYIHFVETIDANGKGLSLLVIAIALSFLIVCDNGCSYDWTVS